MLSKNSKIVLGIIVFVSFLCYNFIRLRMDISFLTFQIGNSVNTSKHQQIQEIKEIKKKRHVFFDLGTNNGDSVKFFVDKTVRSEKDSFLKGYGAIDDKKWEIYKEEADHILTILFSKTLILQQHNVQTLE